MRSFILKNILEISGAGAIVGICGLVAVTVEWPTTLAIAPAALFGWAIGVFHGVQAEIMRRAR